MKILILAVFSITILSVFALPKRGEQRIVGGYEVDISEAPYLVYLSTGCGASIISNKVLLTAAHCVYGNPNKMWIRANSSYKNKGGVILPVANYVAHKDYNKIRHDSDIALIFLNYDILEVCPTCQVVQLGLAEPQAGENLTIRGWGKLSQDGVYPYHLRKIIIPIMEKKRCQEIYYILNITDNMFCAQKNNQGVCSGDSGSPAINDNGHQVGIASFSACASGGIPDGFVVVSQFLEWIDSVVQQEKYQQ